YAYPAEVVQGGTLQLEATVPVVGGASAAVRYTSEYPTLTVNETTGLVTALPNAMPGNFYIIKVESVANPNLYTNMSITVRAPYVQSVTIKENYNQARILRGETFTFEATVVKHGEISDKVTWSTNNSQVTIDPDTGVLTIPEDATPGGPFIVTATSKASAFTKDTRSFYITDVTGISFFRTDYEVRPGGKINIIPNVQVVGYAPNTVNWEYDEDIVESIDSDID